MANIATGSPGPHIRWFQDRL